MTEVADTAEGVLDPWVTEWFAANGALVEPPEEYTPEYLAMARPANCPFPTRKVAKVTDERIESVPVRIYEHDAASKGVVVYFHGGGFCTGSIGLMENIATELAHSTQVTVVSVGYRLSPEHPYPSGLEDCEAVTRAILANISRFTGTSSRVVVAGESAGGTLAAAVAQRLRDHGGPELTGQLLLYPAVAPPSATFASRAEQGGPMLEQTSLQRVWDMYSGGRNVDRDPYAAPLQAETFSNLPPALIVVGGCDMLRDEGRAYGSRLRDAGVAVEEVCYSGQPHGFLNLSFPVSSMAYDRIGTWLGQRFE